MSETHKGACFCGAVNIEATGAPEGMGYCHCESCRSWSAGPVNAFSLWRPDTVKVTKGADKIETFNKTSRSARKFCGDCGGHVMTDHPEMGLTDVYAATIPTLDFKPALHVFYGESVLPIKDGLPKFRDVPADLGGSGETLPE
ncbi:MAG: GFA family protein [Pseudomonadota bacterium]